MRDGLRTISDLVDRIEGDDVVVDDVSLSRAEDEELAVEISARLRDGDSTAGSADDEDESETDRSNRGETPDGTRTARRGSSISSDGGAVPSDDGTSPKSRRSVGPNGVSPGFGALSASIGGTVAGSIAVGLAAADRNGTNGEDVETVDATGGGTPERNGETPDNYSASTSTDELVACRVDGCDETFETDHGMKIHATKAHQSDDGSAPSPHRDPERLQEVYEACETFEEMTEALGVDVTPQTVRRSMMRLGVHDPNPDADGPIGSPPTRVSEERSSAAPDGEALGVDDEGSSESGAEGSSESSGEGPAETGSEDQAESEADGEVEAEVDDEAPVGSADDVPDESATGDSDGERDSDPDEPDASADDAVAADADELLPEAVDGDAFVAAVREGSTLYEVQRGLDMEREEVQTLLAELGLLDLVHGRVATQGEREDRKAEIERRILERLGDGAGADSDERSGGDGDEQSGDQHDDGAVDRSGEQAGAD